MVYVLVRLIATRSYSLWAWENIVTKLACMMRYLSDT